jgi:hypothetical protein
MKQQAEAKQNANSLRPTQSAGRLLQRNCACGQHTIGGSTCSDCSKKTGALQRQPAHENEDTQLTAIESPSVHETLRSPGQPLDADVRTFMEPRFQQDFSRVRVHTDVRAAESARSVGALAYTVGQDVVFGAGRYEPATTAGRQLLAHELTHVAQQQSGSVGFGQVLQRQRPGTQDPLHDPLIEEFRREQGFPPGGRDPLTGAQAGPTSGEIKYRLLPGWLAARPPARFINPRPQAQDPLARLAAGGPPGLTTPMINNTLIRNQQDILNGIVPTQLSLVSATAGATTCQVARNFEFTVSAEVIVASNAGPQGWVGTIPAGTLSQSAPQCTGQAQIPATMNASPSNADFVTRVNASEQEHVTAIHALHDRHFVPYGQFVMSITGSGPTLADCGQNLVTQLSPRATQAAYSFVFGYAAETARLDFPSGTHADRLQVTTDPSCTTANLSLSASNPRIPGSSPGNVVPVAPATVTFNPSTASVNATGVLDGATSIKTFSTPQNAQSALQAIQHYGMTSRNVIDRMEYFLVGGAAPSGPLAGANELAINPDNYQVSRGLPGMPNDWIIAEVAGTNINTIVNFGANRDAAYSAYDVMRQFRFTYLCWIGGTRQSPEMMYFRT